MHDYGTMRTAIRTFNEHVRTLDDLPTPSGCCPTLAGRLDDEFRCTECGGPQLG